MFLVLYMIFLSQRDVSYEFVTIGQSLQDLSVSVFSFVPKDSIILLLRQDYQWQHQFVVVFVWNLSNQEGCILLPELWHPAYHTVFSSVVLFFLLCICTILVKELWHVFLYIQL